MSFPISLFLLLLTLLSIPTDFGGVQLWQVNGYSYVPLHDCRGITNSYSTFNGVGNNLHGSSLKQTSFHVSASSHNRFAQRITDRKRVRGSSGGPDRSLVVMDGFLNIGTPEVVVIMAVGYFVLGPQDLYRLTKEIGTIYGSLKDAASDAFASFQDTMESNSISELGQEVNNLANIKDTFVDKFLDTRAEKAVKQIEESGLSVDDFDTGDEWGERLKKVEKTKESSRPNDDKIFDYNYDEFDNSIPNANQQGKNKVGSTKNNQMNELDFDEEFLDSNFMNKKSKDSNNPMNEPGLQNPPPSFVPPSTAYPFPPPPIQTQMQMNNPSPFPPTPFTPPFTPPPPQQQQQPIPPFMNPDIMSQTQGNDGNDMENNNENNRMDPNSIMSSPQMMNLPPPPPGFPPFFQVPPPLMMQNINPTNQSDPNTMAYPMPPTMPMPYPPPPPPSFAYPPPPNFMPNVNNNDNNNNNNENNINTIGSGNNTTNSFLPPPAPSYYGMPPPYYPPPSNDNFFGQQIPSPFPDSSINDVKITSNNKNNNSHVKQVLPEASNQQIPPSQNIPQEKTEEELAMERKAKEEAAKRFSAQLSGDWNSKILEMEKSKKSNN